MKRFYGYLLRRVRARRRVRTLDAYWSHEITAQEAARQLAEIGR